MRRPICALALAILLTLLALAAPAAADGHEAPGAPLAFRSISAGTFHTCAVLLDARIKCWGEGNVGALGQGNINTRGDDAGEMGTNLALTNLGTGRTATAVSAGTGFNCALLDNSTVKCWGTNFNGLLGIGTSGNFIGDGPSEMGDALVAVDLGAGNTPVAVSSGGATCAVMSNGNLKCWGNNNAGQLGQGDTNNRGDGPNEMGANLPPVDLGPGRTAVAVSNPGSHVCAVLDDGSVKCWGLAGGGRLGHQIGGNQGDQPNEMGANNPPVALGSGRTAAAVVTGSAHSCALLDNGSVKCWGQNGLGQLGLGDTTNRGDVPAQMGDGLPAVDLGPGRTATAITAGTNQTCVLLDNATVKCWGAGADGALGNGSTANLGDGPGEMGAALAPVDLGPGRTALAVTAGQAYACAVLDDFSLKCWGSNGKGQLGQGDVASRGDNASEMGSNLTAVDVGARAVPGPDLGITVLADDTSYVVGEDIHYTVTATNTGGVPLTGVTISDTDLAGCAGAIGNLAVGGSGFTTCSHTAVEADIGTYSHSATVDSDQTTAVASAPSQVTVGSGAAMTVEVAADQTQVVAGEDIDYTVTVTNTGPAPLTEVAITDTDVPGCAATVGDLAVGTDHEVTCSHTTSDADVGTFSHSAGADSDETDPVTSAPSQVTVVPGPAMEVSIFTEQEAVLVGEPIDYTVMVTNAGGVPLTGVQVTDTDLPGCAGTIGSLAVAASASTTCSHIAAEADVGLYTHGASADSDQTDAVVATPHQIAVHRLRPDGRIRLGGGAVAGNNVYNTTGVSQGRAATVGNRGAARFTVTVQNDGTAQENLRVTGFGSSSRYLVTYKVDGQNVTAVVTGDGFSFDDVDPGGLRTMTVVITARNNIPRGAAVTRKITVASGLADVRDVVKATVTRR